MEDLKLGFKKSKHPDDVIFFQPSSEKQNGNRDMAGAAAIHVYNNDYEHTAIYY